MFGSLTRSDEESILPPSLAADDPTPPDPHVVPNALSMPMDCWGEILSFISDFTIANACLLVSKSLREYLMTENPDCLRHVYFPLRRAPAGPDSLLPQPHVACLLLDENGGCDLQFLSYEKCRVWARPSPEEFAAIFPNLRHLIHASPDHVREQHYHALAPNLLSFEARNHGYLQNEAFENMASLETLRIENCSGPVNDACFVHLPNLLHLTIDSSGSFGTGGFSSLTKLQTLILRKCDSDLTSTAFSASGPTLRKLVLDHCGGIFRDVSGFDSLSPALEMCSVISCYQIENDDVIRAKLAARCGPDVLFEFVAFERPRKIGKMIARPIKLVKKRPKLTKKKFVDADDDSDSSD